METTLGQVIGKIKHTGSVKNDNGDKYQMTVTIDFTTASDIDVRSWLCANRFIAGQRPWRALSLDELRELDGQTFVATEIGRKVKSRTERIAGYTSMGLPESMAIIAVDQPAKFHAMMEAANQADTEDIEEAA